MKTFLKKYWVVSLSAFIGMHLILLSKITFFPYPELFVYSYLTKSGLIPYKQIFDQHFPGLVFFSINLATAGIDTVFEYRVLQLIVVAITQVILFFIAKKLFKSNFYALTSNFLYLVWQPFFEGNVLWIDSFVPPLLLGAFYCIYVQKSKKVLFVGGLLLGISLLLKQVAGPLIAVIGLYLIWRDKSIKKISPFAIGVLIPVSYLLFWVTNLGIWSDFFYWTVTFNMTTFAEMGRTSPSVGQLVRTLPSYGVAVAGIWNILKRWSDSFMLTLIFFIGSLLFVYARFDYIHLQPALPFAVLIIVGAINSYATNRSKWIYSGIFVYAIVILYLLIPFYRANWNGGVRFFGEFEKKMSEKVLMYAKPKDSVFALGTTPHLYYLTQTLPPGNIFVFQFPWFMKETEGEVLEGIKKDPPKVVVRDLKSEVSDMKLVDYMPRVNSYIEENYKVVDDVEGTEIMIPN